MGLGPTGGHVTADLAGDVREAALLLKQQGWRVVKTEAFGQWPVYNEGEVAGWADLVQVKEEL